MKESESVNNNIQISPELLQQLTINQERQQDDEIDLAELWRAIWAGKWIIIAITSIFAVASVFYALSLPNIYKSEALLAPAEQQSGGLGGMASQLGGLASLAGVNLGGGGNIDKTALALEIMKSRVFVSQFIDQHQLLVPLMASKGWNRDANELILDKKLYDKATNKWIREVKPPFTPRPSAQEAYKEFQKIVSASQDKTSSMVNISIKHHSPEIAKQWVNWLIDAINLEMKTRDLTEAQKSISYLEKQLSQTKVSELQDVLYQLIEEQTKTIMFANVREQYVFKTIDPALVPEIKDSPKRALICVLGVLLGGILAVMVVLIRYFSKK
jgi:uncharacterized protein involved in exopolysaccharide biosynthesis